MSWDSYRVTVTTSGHAKQAAIVGHEGGVWSSTPGLNITADEVKTLMSGFANAVQLQSSGVWIGGTRYMYIQSDSSQIQGKKGADGVSIAKAGKCLVIGIYTDGQSPGNCRAVVEKMRDYLVGSGY